MSRHFQLAVLCFAAHVGLASASEVGTPEPPLAKEARACSGVANESTKKRELMRELAAYIGQTVPDELRDRATKHLEQVVALKEECERLKRVSAATAK